MYIDFQQNQVCRSVKPVHTNLFAQYISQVVLMRPRKMYMYIHFQQNWVFRSVKPWTQIYLHNIASCIDLQLPIVILK